MTTVFLVYSSGLDYGLSLSFGFGFNLPGLDGASGVHPLGQFLDQVAAAHAGAARTGAFFGFAH